MPQEHEATDGPASALSASLLKHFGTARAGDARSPACQRWFSRRRRKTVG
jgi:hypothetical protein